MRRKLPYQTRTGASLEPTSISKNLFEYGGWWWQRKVEVGKPTWQSCWKLAPSLSQSCLMKPDTYTARLIWKSNQHQIFRLDLSTIFVKSWLQLFAHRHEALRYFNKLHQNCFNSMIPYSMGQMQHKDPLRSLLLQPSQFTGEDQYTQKSYRI